MKTPMRQDKVVLQEAITKLRRLMEPEFKILIEELTSLRLRAERNQRDMMVSNEFERGRWAALYALEELLKGDDNG